MADKPSNFTSAPPIPPEQFAPWTAPATHLSPVVASAFTELFTEGVADPRGCEYREIEVPDGNQSGYYLDAAGPTKTHGWVLPGGKFAICWNGLVYPISAAGNRPTSARISSRRSKRTRNNLPSGRGISTTLRSHGRTQVKEFRSRRGLRWIQSKKSTPPCFCDWDSPVWPRRYGRDGSSMTNKMRNKTLILIWPNAGPVQSFKS